jgi:hypothetical protein
MFKNLLKKAEKAQIESLLKEKSGLTDELNKLKENFSELNSKHVGEIQI